MNIDPRHIDTQFCYQLMTSSIVPRPIAWISTLASDGTLNLAPYSFFTVASCTPPVLLVTQVNPRNRPNKDTLNNLIATQECVVNIVSMANVEIMNASCADYPSDMSEFKALGIESVASAMVKVDGVKNAQVRFECKLRDVIEISPLPASGKMMLLDVVQIYVDDQLMQQQQIDPGLLDAVGKLGGDNYATIHERFILKRPTFLGK